MLRTALLAATVVLALAPAAFGASYKTGRYKAGSARGDGVTLRISQGSFSIARISFMETCTNATDSFTDRFTFLRGTLAKLTGTINRRGRLSGRYDSAEGTIVITGRVRGSEATVNATESGTYRPTDGREPYACSGARVFKAKRIGG